MCLKEKISLVEDIDRMNADIVVKSILRNKIIEQSSSDSAM